MKDNILEAQTIAYLLTQQLNPATANNTVHNKGRAISQRSTVGVTSNRKATNSKRDSSGEGELTVDDFSCGLVLGDDLVGGKVELLLLPDLIVRRHLDNHPKGLEAATKNTWKRHEAARIEHPDTRGEFGEFLTASNPNRGRGGWRGESGGGGGRVEVLGLGFGRAWGLGALGSRQDRKSVV